MAAKKKTAVVVPLSTELEAPEPDPSRRIVRWLVPAAAAFPAYQHAAMISPTRADFTICKAHHVDGSVYPPAEGTPKCNTCTATLARLEALEATKEAPIDG